MRFVSPYYTTTSFMPSLWREMDDMFDKLTKTSSLVYDERRFDPATDVSETDEHYLMSIDLPGMKKEDIKIDVNDNMITISGERKQEVSADKKHKVQRFEKSYGYFKRSFSLPNSVNVEKVEARFDNGVLELYLPKTHLAQTRHIEIQSGKGGFFERLLGGAKKGATEEKDVNSPNKAS